MPTGVYKRKKKTLAERFWPKVNKTGGCWLWTGAKYKTGYGSIGSEVVRGRAIKAHRASWEIHFGAIPAGLHVLHKCDTPLCVRPDHLFLGTHQDNMRDMALKGRSTIGDRNPSRLYPDRVARGSRSGHAKLNSVAVLCIRYLHRIGVASYAEMSESFGVSESAISMIINRRRWAHLKGDITCLT